MGRAFFGLAERVGKRERERQRLAGCWRVSQTDLPCWTMRRFSWRVVGLGREVVGRGSLFLDGQTERRGQWEQSGIFGRQTRAPSSMRA